MSTSTDPIPTPSSPPPDILRAASMELVVTDLAESRHFYVDVLGLVVTEEDAETAATGPVRSTRLWWMNSSRLRR